LGQKIWELIGPLSLSTIDLIIDAFTSNKGVNKTLMSNKK
tara:strand:- start:226 stop:345 length:120 start_codon:yes stop_codon:yes gene_type:complete